MIKTMIRGNQENRDGSVQGKQVVEVEEEEEEMKTENGKVGRNRIKRKCEQNGEWSNRWRNWWRNYSKENTCKFEQCPG
jgi:hypothetical protein